MGDVTPSKHYQGPHDIVTSDGRWRTDQEIIAAQQREGMYRQPILPEENRHG